MLVNRFEISGNRAISSEQLLAQIADQQGKPLTLNEIYAVADKLTAFYRTQGYSLAAVAVPAQQVSSGVIKLEVLEGRLGAISFSGNKIYGTEFLTQLLAGGLAAGAPVSVGAVETELLKLNELPGLSARAIIQPGAEYGSSDVVIKTTEKRFQGRATLDNYGRTSIGEWRITGSGAVNNPLGFGDRLDLTVLHSQQGLLEYGGGAYDLPVGKYGTHVSVFGSYYDYDIDEDTPLIGVLDLTGTGATFGVNLTQPIVRTRTDHWAVSLGADRTITTQEGGVGETRHLSLLRLSTQVTHLYDRGAYSNLNAEAASNFNHNEDGTEENQQMGKLRLDVSHLQPLWRAWSVYLKGSGQVSFDPLDDLERFRLGGFSNVRAYAPAELSGDQGAAATVELRRPLAIPGVPAMLRMYADAGLVHRIEPFVGEEPTNSLTGVGMGLDARVMRRYTMRFDLNQPLSGDHEASDEREMRFWASFSADF